MDVPKIYPFGSKTEFVSVLIVLATKGTQATVYRQYGNNLVEIVRGAENFPITTDETLFIDYEVPQDYEITYWVKTTSGKESLESNKATSGPYNFGRDVIFDLADPKRGMRIYVESFKQQQYGISRDVQRVWGRRDPVVISGVREMPAGQLVLLTLELSERENLLEIVQNGSTIAFAPWKRTYGLPGVSYFAVGDVNEIRATDIAAQTARRWTLDVQEVSPPPAVYRYPSYGKTWREFRDNTWRVEADHQWWEAVA